MMQLETPGGEIIRRIGHSYSQEPGTSQTCCNIWTTIRYEEGGTMRRMKRIAVSMLICSLLIGLTGCRTAAGAPVKDLAVAGSTFAEPLYVKQLDAWYQKTQVKAVYGALSSSGALRALQDRTIDVGATDLLLEAEDQARLPASVLQIPTCLGAVAICVNLPGNPALRMDAALVSAIFRGIVKTWNDARIAALNPLVKLPDTTV